MRLVHSRQLRVLSLRALLKLKLMLTMSVVCCSSEPHLCMMKTETTRSLLEESNQAEEHGHHYGDERASTRNGGVHGR
ncbi:hypothetical protein KCU98_g24, partial [Aureobasidium melanogenum]